VKGEHHIEFRCCFNRSYALIVKPNSIPSMINRTDIAVSPLEEEYMQYDYEDDMEEIDEDDIEEHGSIEAAENVRKAKCDRELLANDPLLARKERIFSQRKMNRVIRANHFSDANISQFCGRLFWLECVSIPIPVSKICAYASLLRVLILTDVTFSVEDVETMIEARLPIAILGKYTRQENKNIYTIIVISYSTKRFSNRKFRTYDERDYDVGKKSRIFMVSMVG
jgi:hypothetical protein